MPHNYDIYIIYGMTLKINSKLIYIYLRPNNFRDLPVKWPKLLGPFQNGFPNFLMCMCLECYSTSFPVQRSQTSLESD